jgi:arylsulfatase A-like enzyme
VQGLISQVDLVPTILSAVGQDTPDAIDGVDALPLLRGDVDAVRDAAIIEFTDDPRCLRLKTVITPEHKLTYYHGYGFGELYDLRSDSGEVVNLWNAPSYAAERQSLMARILDHMEPLERRASRICYA